MNTVSNTNIQNNGSRDQTPLYYKMPTEYSTLRMRKYTKEPMTKECKQPVSGVTHAAPILLLWLYKCDTNGL